MLNQMQNIFAQERTYKQRIIHIAVAHTIAGELDAQIDAASKLLKAGFEKH